MKKIPTLFQRSEDRRSVVPIVTPGCEWVLTGQGQATRKYDGTCILIATDGVYARREVKTGKAAPPGFVPADHDPITGTTVGWEPIEQCGFAKFASEALEARPSLPVGTYELCGPKINGNPEHFAEHRLIRHETAEPLDAPRTFDELGEWLHAHTFEGIVWHHPDGRMAKLKRRDFR